MATTALGTVLHNLRRSLLRHDEVGLTDGELLECFVTRHDEDAFAALVRRHGPMVLGVCRRVLRNEADAEDAFQATFFVLVRKAASIRPRGMVGNWLYGVAHSTALKARAMSTKRLAKERAAAARPKPDGTGETWQELQALLDQELKVLPDIYRVAIVLCDLEGKSMKEAARQLGCPQGTVGTRLARGRILLSRRLARHGLTLSGGLIATVIAQNVAAAGVPPLLMSSTVKAATLIAAGQATAGGVISAKVAALTEGVLQAMLMTKLKIATAVLIVVALAGVCGTVMVSPTAMAFGQTEKKKDGTPRKTGEPKGEKAKDDKVKIQGTWEVIDEEVDGGMSATFDKTNPPVWVIAGDKIEIKKGKMTFKLTYKLDSSKDPKEIDITRSEGPSKGEMTKNIYTFDKDGNLIICGGRDMLDHPKDFNVERGTGYCLRTFKRLPPIKDEETPKKEDAKPAKENSPKRVDDQVPPPQPGPGQLRLPLPKKDAKQPEPPLRIWLLPFQVDGKRVSMKDVMINNVQRKLDANMKKLAESKDEKAEQEALEAIEKNVKELKDALNLLKGKKGDK